MTLTNPLISVIIPAANSESTIIRALDSIRIFEKNLDARVEAIVLVNNSTDNTYHLASSYSSNANRQVRVFHCAGGRSHARNVGLSYAKGRIGIFLDSDDELKPIYLQEVLTKKTQILNNHTPLYCKAVHVFDETGRRTEPIELPSPKRLCIENPFVIETVAFSLSDVRFRFDEQLVFCEDWKFWALNFMNSSFLPSNVEGVRVHITGNNSMRAVKSLLKSEALVRADLFQIKKSFAPKRDLIRLILFPQLDPSPEELGKLNESFGFLFKISCFLNSFFPTAYLIKKLLQKKLDNVTY